MAASSTPVVTSVWTIWVTALLCLYLGSSFTKAQEVEFDYTSGPNGPANWGNLNVPNWETCKTGMMQSPLAITPELMVTDDDLDSELDIKYPKYPIPANISNDGHTIELDIPDGIVELKINGVKYKARQMHFHYPSEHTILNYTFPLELHLVHVADDNKIAVVGWLFTLGEDSPFLAQFFDKLPAYESETHEPIDPITLLPAEGTYGRYMGSLTTPPCTENITWTVMLWDFPTVSSKQLDLLKVALPHPNARPTQPANGRKFFLST